MHMKMEPRQVARLPAAIQAQFDVHLHNSTSNTRSGVGRREALRMRYRRNQHMCHPQSHNMEHSKKPKHMHSSNRPSCCYCLHHYCRLRPLRTNARLKLLAQQ